MGNWRAVTPSESDEFAEAKDLFFRYDASRFYMSRDGVEARYEQYGVPAHIEAEWKHELTQSFLARLSESADRRALNFLITHRRTEYLETALDAKLDGRLRHLIVYLEQLADYLDLADAEAIGQPAVQDSLQDAIARGRALESRARSSETRSRLADALDALQGRCA